MSSYIDENETKKFLTLLHGSGKSFEIRLFDPNKRGGATSAFFNNIDKCVETLSHCNLENRNVFVTLHEVKEGLELDCRVQWERLERGADALADKDFANYQTFFIDLDPDRPKGVASSTEEYNKAVELAKMVMEYLENLGFSAPIVASSGNGIHLQYRIAMPCNDENKNLLKGCLESLARHFAEQCKTLGVGVDCVNFNPARICKLYGTVSRKGRHTEKRPHRLTKIIKQPEEWELNSKELLEKIIAENPPESIPAPRNTDKKSASKSVPLASSGIDVEGKLNEWGLEYMEPYSGTDNKGIPCNIYPLEHCPFNSDHAHGDSKIFKYANGAVSFKCHHDSCKGHKWQDVRLLFEPNAYKNGYKEPEIIEKDLLNRVAELTAEELTSEKLMQELYFALEGYDRAQAVVQVGTRAKQLRVYRTFKDLWSLYERQQDNIKRMEEKQRLQAKQAKRKKEEEEQEQKKAEYSQSVDDSFLSRYEKLHGHKAKLGTMLFSECRNIRQALNIYANMVDYTHYSHTNKKTGEITGYIQQGITEEIINNFDLFIYAGKPYIYIKGSYRADLDCLLLRDIIRAHIDIEHTTDNYLNAITQLVCKTYSLQRDITEENQNSKDYFINFKNGMLNLLTMELLPHEPEYFSLNQIPWEWKPKHSLKDSIVKEYFETLLKNEDDRKMFFEYIGYMMTPSTRFQYFLMIKGTGGTGKGVVLRLIQKMLGSENYVNLKLQELNGDQARFKTAYLLGKLGNIFGDLPDKDLETIEGIKTITGEDGITGEYKGGKIFSFKPFCKLLFSCNKVPKAINDKSNAYYRRLLILKINQRGKEIENIEKVLLEDMQSFIFMAVMGAHELFTAGTLHASATSAEEKRILYEDTDSVYAFLNSGIYEQGTIADKVERTELHKNYIEWAQKEGIDERYRKSMRGFLENLRDKGYAESHSGAERYILGLKKTDKGTKVEPEEFVKINGDLENEIPFP